MRTGTAYPEAQIKVSAPFEDRPKYKSVDISHSILMASVLTIENLLRFKFCFGSNVSLVDSRSKIRSATKLEWYMNRSLSPFDLQRESNLFQEELQQVQDSEAAVQPSQLRTSDPQWLLIDEGFTLAREHETESLFAIANGYVGNRGSLAEGSP